MVKFNKWGSVVLVAAATLMLSACGGSSSSAGEKTADGKPVLTAIVTTHGLTKSNDRIEWLNRLQKKLGIKIKWEKASSDWGQKKAPMLASGDLPDLLIGPNVVTDDEFGKYKGLFEDLSKDMDKLPNVKQMFTDHPETKVLAQQSGGAIYGVSKYQRFWPKSATRQYINKKWLDKLGLKEPTTWDELYNVLLAFKTKDPNGNGKADEIPMDWSPVGTGGFGYFQPMVLLASTGIVPSEGGNQGYYVEDGQVKNFFTDSRYKKVIEFLRKCWTAGLINPKAFSQDYSQYQSTGRGKGNTALVGFSWGWEASDRFGSALASQYASIAPLKMSASTSVKPVWSVEQSLNYNRNMIVLSAKSKNKKAALKFINALYGDETSLQVLFGAIPEYISKKNDTYTVLPPKDKAVDPGTWKWTNTWADNGPMYIRNNLKVNLGTDMKSVVEQDKALSDAYKNINPETQVYPATFLKYSDADNTTLANNNTVLLNQAMPKFAQWITKGGIDKDWSGYVQTLNNKSGVKQNLKIMQKAYDKYEKSDIAASIK